MRQHHNSDVSRDVEDDVRELDGVQVYDIADLQAMVNGDVEVRRAAIPHAELIIQPDNARFSASC